MNSSILKQLLTGLAPILLVFGLGWLGWAYINGAFQGPGGPGLNALYPLWETQPEWWTRWYPTTENQANPYHNRLASTGPEAEEAYYSLLKSTQQEIASFRPSDDEQAIDKELAARWVAQQLAYEPFDLYEFDLAADGGQPEKLMRFLTHEHSVQNEADVQNLVRRFEQLPAVCRGWEETLLLQAQAGTLPSRNVIQRSQQMFARWAEQPRDSHPLYLGFTRQLARVPDVEINEYVALDRLTALDEQLVQQIRPAFARIATVLDSLTSHARAEIGLTHLPKGDAYYRLRLQQYSALMTDPDSLGDFAAEQVRYWEKRMDAFFDSLKAEGVEGELTALGKQEGWQLTEDSARVSFLAACRAQIRQARTISYGLTDTLPKDRIDLWPGLQADLSAQTYIPASLDRKRSPRLELNMSGLLPWVETDRVLTLYEQVIPGRHLLMHRHQQAGARSSIRRTLIDPRIYEGWPAYASHLVEHDLMAMSGQAILVQAYFERQHLRAIRLAVDVGIHHEGWTEQDARQYLQSRTVLDDRAIEDLLWQVVSHPGRAAAAVTGMKFLQDLRAETATRLGENFYLGEYHNALLFEGALPPDLLKARIQAWQPPSSQ